MKREMKGEGNNGDKEFMSRHELGKRNNEGQAVGILLSECN